MRVETMDQLPEEVLLQIFKFMDKKSKLKTFLVCKKFYEILSNSPVLMSDFVLNLEIQWRLDSLELSEFQLFSTIERKFKKCKIYGSTPNPVSQSLIKVNDKLGETLKTLELNQFKINSNALIALINSFPNLEEVSFLNLEIFDVAEGVECQEVNESKLKKVIIDSRTHSEVDIMEILQPVKTVRYLEIKYFADDFEDFLVNQEKLEHLKLGQLTIHPHARDIKDKIKFQLKTLAVGRGIVNLNFLDFLATQNELESLSILYFNDLYQGYLDELLEIILNQSSLKSLQLRFLGKLACDQSILTKTNLSLKNLEINCVGIANDSSFSPFFSSFVRMFPNLQKMRLSNYPSASAFSLDIIFALNSLTKLKELIVDYCPRNVMGTLSFEKLERFELSNGEITNEDWIQFFNNNKSIKDLKVEIPYFEAPVMQKLSELKEIQRLELNVAVYNSIIPIVEKCKNLRKFQIRLQGCKPSDAKEVNAHISSLGFTVSRQAFIVTLKRNL